MAKRLPESQDELDRIIRDRLKRFAQQHETERTRLQQRLSGALDDNVVLRQQIELLQKAGRLRALIDFFRGGKHGQ